MTHARIYLHGEVEGDGVQALLLLAPAPAVQGRGRGRRGRAGRQDFVHVGEGLVDEAAHAAGLGLGGLWERGAAACLVWVVVCGGVVRRSMRKGRLA